MPTPDFLQKRLSYVENRLNSIEELLDAVYTALMQTTEPNDKIKYQSEIKRLKELRSEVDNEYFQISGLIDKLEGQTGEAKLIELLVEIKQLLISQGRLLPEKED